MGIDITNRGEIEALDASGVLKSIDQLADQIADAWNQTSVQDNRAYAAGVTQVVVAGMGGSALGAYVIKALAKQSLKVPLEVCNDYTLPGYVNEHTLVILSSYSGTTEETLAAANDAEAKGAKLAVITSGGDLARLAAAKQCPAYIINPIHNPSNQPRMAIGYAIAGQIGLLHSLGLVDFDANLISQTVAFLKQEQQAYQPESTSNPAVMLAQEAVDSILYLISAEHLTGATHVVNNQLNENAKHLTVELQLPELNHHYMEGLPHPAAAKQVTKFWLMQSPLYSARLQLRVRLTKDVIEKNGYQARIIEVKGDNPFTQVFSLIQLGAYTNFYLAMLHGIDPAPIPWVDYFKEQLKVQGD